MVAIKEIIGRAWFYTRLGWGNYIAWWLGVVAYITIIYALALEPLRLLPTGIWTYLLIFVAMMLGSFFLGYFMKEIRIYGIEHKINTETNPYINILIGRKEILGYQNSISALEREMNNYEVQSAICKKLGLDAQLPILAKNMTMAASLKAQLEEMLEKAAK